MSAGTHRNGASGPRRELWSGLGALAAVLLVIAIVAATNLGSSKPSSVTVGGTASAMLGASPSAWSETGLGSGAASGSAAARTSSGAAASSAGPSIRATAQAVPRAAPSATPSAAAAALAVPSRAGVGTEQPALAPAEKIGQSEPVAQDVSVRVTGIKATQGVAEGIGERSGPAVRITFELKNNSGRPVSTASAVANVDYGPNRVPADELRGKRPVTFAPSITNGETTTASFVYLVPTDQRGDLRITFFFDPAVPAAQFTGSAT